ncbi:YihY/virulence factor BrkB family protein [Thalassobacillus pellis]|uniref:YihY/virulence factor BrkB family protein n=1 Tax=Thalassobacillus pellis TaxID=748008 RepID=UPI0019611BB6|nr:YihY/virulence factor BrkB family protein [Thalassobacillus pellis]MBM7554165.1 membrane protein [Thalassobacillus pellis]
MKLKNYIKEVIHEFQKDDVPILAAAQAYYYLLAIVPLMILLLSIIPYLSIDPDRAVRFISNNIPGQTAEIFKENIISLVSQPKGGLLSIGIIGTLWAASNGMNAFMKASNHAYEVEETRSFIVARLLSIILTIGMIIAFVVALVLPVFGKAILSFLDSALNLPMEIMILLHLLRWIVSLIVMIGLLTVLYRVAPNKKLPFGHIIPGAITATVLWLLISWAFSFYVSNFANYSATYGSLGGIIILMLWFFLTGLILVLGAEVNVVQHRRKLNEKYFEDKKAQES